MKKKFDEEIIIEWLVIPIVLVFAFTVWWLSSKALVPREEETTTETTTRIVENIVENVENTYIPETDIKPESELKIEELGTFKITGYTPTCSHCCLKSDGIGSSGRKIEAGKSVAMNKQDMKKHGFKYGDKIYIVGIGEREIEDTGCKQGVIDVACDSHESCYKVTGFYEVKRVML